MITYFSVVNLNSPVPVCDLHFQPENPVPGCIMIACEAPAGWGCSFIPITGGVSWEALFPGPDCIVAGSRKGGFSFTLDPDFCCYVVSFTGPQHEILGEQEECFTCVHVGVQNKTWSDVKKLYN